MYYMEAGYPTDDDRMNSHYAALLRLQKKSADSPTAPMQDNPKRIPDAGNGEAMMDFTTLLEAMDGVMEQMPQLMPQDTQVELSQDSVEENSDPDDNTDLLDTLNRIFTPVLIMQTVEHQIADDTNANMSDAGVLNEKTMISFDDPTRMSQLLAVCALLLGQKKNTQNWQLYQKAAAIKTQSKLAIQREEMNGAKALAQQYLMKVATTNPSKMARDAAMRLMPQTQH